MKFKSMANRFVFCIAALVFAGFLNRYMSLIFKGKVVLIEIVGALSATVLGSWGFIGAMLFYSLVKFVISKQLLITFGIPTILSALCFKFSLKTESLLERRYLFCLQVLVPLFCIVAFIVNPIGREAYFYSFYWLTPLALYFYSKLQMEARYFSSALASTFVAHGIGSIFYLYTFNTTATFWLGLIPLVFAERLFAACFISLLYKIIFGFASYKRVIDKFLLLQLKKLGYSTPNSLTFKN